MTAFQRTPQILMTHAGNGIEKLEDMKGKGIMISASATLNLLALFPHEIRLDRLADPQLFGATRALVLRQDGDPAGAGHQ